MNIVDHFEQTLKDQITRLAESTDASSEQRVLDRLRQEPATAEPRRRRFRRTLVAGCAGVAAAALAVVALNGTGVIGDESSSAPAASGAHRQTGTALNQFETWGPGEHCSDVKSTGVTELAAKTITPMWLPTGWTSKVTDSWDCGGAPVVMVGKVQFSFESGWGDVDIAHKWQDLIKDYGGYTATIAGHEALIQPGSSSKGLYNQIMIVDHHTLIRLLSTPDVPMSQMLHDAKALDFAHPVATPQHARHNRINSTSPEVSPNL